MVDSNEEDNESNIEEEDLKWGEEAEFEDDEEDKDDNNKEDEYVVEEEKIIIPFFEEEESDHLKFSWERDDEE